ncbi:MAG: hypothetical protein IT424_01505 [Pirellulales bacterium]|nr:hypothetical protein [Pirellulales bacterium]
MKLVLPALYCAAWIGWTAAVHAAVTTTSTRGFGASELDAQILSDDVLDGLIATELPGDAGWHPANPAAGDSLNPNGLPAFTDGTGALGVFTGLLNDFPEPLGAPVKRLQYDLAGPTDIERIHILSGNINNADGRIFTTTVVRYSGDGGDSFSDLGYFESAPLGSINNESGVPDTTEDHALLLEIFDDLGADLASGATNLQFDFYSVDNTGGQYRDPFDGVNPFTGLDDNLSAAFVSPLIWEIDVVGQGAAAASADFDGDGDVDGADFLTWQDNAGALGTGTRATGDANLDTNVNDADLAVWEGQFGGGAMTTAVPEPGAAGLGMLATAAAAVARRGRRSWGRADDWRRRSARR